MGAKPGAGEAKPVAKLHHGNVYCIQKATNYQISW
jgi:hypothetical protein